MSTEVDDYLAHLGIDPPDLILTEDEFAHFGKKGMKWGVRNDDSSGGAGGGSSQPSRKEKRAAQNEEIISARGRQREREVEVQRQAFKTYSASGEKAAAAALKKYDKMEADLLTNPDAATAAKLTSGERTANNISLGVLAIGAVGLTALKIASRR